MVVQPCVLMVSRGLLMVSDTPCALMLLSMRTHEDKPCGGSFFCLGRRYKNHVSAKMCHKPCVLTLPENVSSRFYPRAWYMVKGMWTHARKPCGKKHMQNGLKHVDTIMLTMWKKACAQVLKYMCETAWKPCGEQHVETWYNIYGHGDVQSMDKSIWRYEFEHMEGRIIYHHMEKSISRDFFNDGGNV